MSNFVAALLRKHAGTARVPTQGHADDAIPFDSEVSRVLGLPRRESAGPTMTERMSVALRKRERNAEGDVNMLRGPQVEALQELQRLGGLFAPMRVGSGKSLVTLLAPVVLNAKRPVLIIPASLREKTQQDFVRYWQDWNVRLPHLVSYEELGRPDRADMLLTLNPDLLILDEAHRARNKDSAMSRRIRRCVVQCEPKVAVLSGTLMTDALMDYHHLTTWSLKKHAPVPQSTAQAERWARAVDKDVALFRRVPAGALADFPGGFHEHFRASSGVVPTPGSDCTASIQIARWLGTGAVK
jgi:hypothetical protein